MVSNSLESRDDKNEELQGSTEPHAADAKTIRDTSKIPPHIIDTSTNNVRRISPEDVAKALGAEQVPQGEIPKVVRSSARGILNR